MTPKMVDNLAYGAHEALVAPARPKPQIWRLLLGVGLIAAVSYALTSVTFLLVLNLAEGAWIEGLIDGGNPPAMLVLLASFAFLVLGVALAARWFQQRSLQSVIGPMGLLVRQFRRVFSFLLVLAFAVLLLPPYSLGLPLVPNLEFGHWLGLLPLSLAAVLIQTGAEEIVFRGYLQQALAARFRSPLLWLVAPSLLFGLAHYMPIEAGENAVLICLWAMAFGLLMADLTARAGTLGPAIAVHFFNNIVALLVFASPSSLSGLGLYLLPYEMSDTEHLRPWMLVDCAMMLVSWLVARLAIRR
ncbi:CAAX amino terminal protease self-immunity [Phaeobacter sp. CECT 5382]|nr:CAAX amino terminal protease self-immunity [Phaeobacter sp. CECT 5382]